MRAVRRRPPREHQSPSSVPILPKTPPEECIMHHALLLHTDEEVRQVQRVKAHLRTRRVLRVRKGSRSCGQRGKASIEG